MHCYLGDRIEIFHLLKCSVFIAFSIFKHAAKRWHLWSWCANAAPASNSPVLHCCIMPTLRECQPSMMLKCSTDELLARASFKHHGDQGHDELKHHAVLKGLTDNSGSVLTYRPNPTGLFSSRRHRQIGKSFPAVCAMIGKLSRRSNNSPGERLHGKKLCLTHGISSKCIHGVL